MTQPVEKDIYELAGGVLKERGGYAFDHAFATMMQCAMAGDANGEEVWRRVLAAMNDLTTPAGSPN